MTLEFHLTNGRCTLEQQDNLFDVNYGGDRIVTEYSGKKCKQAV